MNDKTWLEVKAAIKKCADDKCFDVCDECRYRCEYKNVYFCPIRLFAAIDMNIEQFEQYISDTMDWSDEE